MYKYLYMTCKCQNITKYVLYITYENIYDIYK